MREVFQCVVAEIRTCFMTSLYACTVLYCTQQIRDLIKSNVHVPVNEAHAFVLFDVVCVGTAIRIRYWLLL